jgi:hypothetical protein
MASGENTEMDQNYENAVKCEIGGLAVKVTMSHKCQLSGAKKVSNCELFGQLF